MMSEYLTLKSTFDVARARAQLRHIAEQHAWTPVVRAKITAVLSILAEMALFKGHAHMRCLELVVDVVQQDNKHGLQITCEIAYTEQDGPFFNVAHDQLNVLAHELSIENRKGHERITVCIWSS